MKYAFRVVVNVCMHGVSPNGPQERFHTCHVEEWRDMVEQIELLYTP